MRLAELEALFWHSVRSEYCPTTVDREFVASAALSARDRMAIYRRMYWYRQVSALKDSFPRLALALGEDNFTRLAWAYVAEHPSEHPTLERLGRNLPAFLAKQSTLERSLVDLALLEWARAEAFVSAHAQVLACTADVLPHAFARSRLIFAASLSTVLVESGALKRWDDPRTLQLKAAAAAADSRLDETEALPGRAVRVAVWRQGFDVMHVPLGSDEEIALSRALSGAPMGEVCSVFEGQAEAVQQALAVLSRWLRRGWVARIDYGEPPPGASLSA